ncbi:hypothetical protein NW756_003135 [Fusarium oxysporum]|nr:hypothetical protein NW753_006486 [Fusarium oxysporum]KAJ4061690.1 hypothetical protein NW763_005081 [Fusarium oxysporum]KAJ4098543.1 hypothetical protein NW756_003135 [Fusarium oxysporum]
MPSPRNILFGLLAASLSSTIVAEHLRVVWSQGDFSTISGPSGGSQSGHSSGFTILKDDGTAIYSKAYPADHSPCYNTGDGREFTFGGDCWTKERKFRCKSSFAGDPESCEVKDQDGNSLGTGEGKTDTTFIGIAIAQDSACVVEFNTDDDEDCPKDEDNNLGVRSDRHFDKYGQFGALPYDHTVNARLSFQHVPTSYSPPAYDHTCPSQLDPESDVSESEPDQSPKDDPQVKTEAKNYIDPVDVILNEIRRLHMADVQLKTELITRLESQCAMYSQSMSVVQGQLSQANKLIEFWGEQTDTNTKQLEIVDSRCLDRHINAQGSIKELSDLMMTDIKERRSFRHSLEDKGLIQIT